MTERIYLAGPMKGLPNFNFPAFHKAAKMLREEGHTVFNPAEQDYENVKLHPSGDESKSEGFCRRTALRKDLTWICSHATAIALLPGWENSSGACAEKALADALELKVRYLTDG